MPDRFDEATLAAVRKSQVIGIRAGSGTHRIIAVWAVVVERRIFIRSWSVSEGGWYATFLEEPAGVFEAGGRRHAIRAVRTRSERLKAAVDRAYAEKYHTPGSLKYVRDLRRAKSRDTTTELKPV